MKYTPTAAAEMEAELRKVAGWLDRLATSAESQATDTRFKSLSEACAADAKNYRYTIKHIMAVVEKAHAK